MYSTIPIHWNIKSAPASPGRSRVGPAFYVFSFLDPYWLTALSQAPSFHSNSNIYSVVQPAVYAGGTPDCTQQQSRTVGGNPERKQIDRLCKNGSRYCSMPNNTRKYCITNIPGKSSTPGVRQCMPLPVHAKHAALSPALATWACLPRARPPVRRTGGHRWTTAGPLHSGRLDGRPTAVTLHGLVGGHVATERYGTLNATVATGDAARWHLGQDPLGSKKITVWVRKEGGLQ